MAMELGDQVADVLREAYEPLPSIRTDTPLSALNFQPSDAVVLAYIAQQHELCVPTDSDFAAIVTLGDLSAILMGEATGSSHA